MNEAVEEEDGGQLVGVEGGGQLHDQTHAGVYAYPMCSEL